MNQGLKSLSFLAWEEKIEYSFPLPTEEAFLINIQLEPSKVFLQEPPAVKEIFDSQDID